MGDVRATFAGKPHVLTRNPRMRCAANVVQSADMEQQRLEAARRRLVELRRDERHQLGVSASAMLASLGLTIVYRPLVLPLFVGGIAVWILAIRSLWRHWDLVDRLAEDPAAHVIPEIAAYAERHGRPDRETYRDHGGAG